MDPLGILLGYAGYHLLKSQKKQLREVGIKFTSEVFNAVDHSKETAYNVKEGFEDIIAEAYYENMKRKNNLNEKEIMESFTNKDEIFEENNGIGENEANNNSE